jgi:hypothetical protein
MEKIDFKKTLKPLYSPPVVPPLEGLWWADDPRSFITREKDRWRWTAPPFPTPALRA